MIAKIGRGTQINGALHYNIQKVNKEDGQVLFTNKMMETPDASYTVAQLLRSFEPYLVANRKTEKPALHISINPDPQDKVSDENYIHIANDYMQQMGYGSQPFVIFKHTDIDRSHIHIVSICVDEQGRKISDQFEKRRSMAICRELEKKYNLIPANEKKQKTDGMIFKPVDYKKGDIKSQVASVVRYLPKYYSFQSLGAYNALLSLFNITAEEVKGELNGQPKNGLVYFALNENGEKASNPFKASLFGKQAGMPALEKHFDSSKEKMKVSTARSTIKDAVETTMNITSGENEFKKQLLEQGINTVIRRNADGRIYGITFIDHESRSVWNGSQLDRKLSAGTFNEWWKEQNSLNYTNEPLVSARESNIAEKEETHELFNFLNKTETTYSDMPGLIEGLGGLLPDAQGENYEELAFENEIKKKKKIKKRRS